MRKRGRPRTMTARFFFGEHTKQLWISKGVLAVLGDPENVVVCVGKDACLEVSKPIMGAFAVNNVLAITQGGYMSGERLWTQLVKQFGTEAYPYFKAVRHDNYIQLVPRRSK